MNHFLLPLFKHVFPSPPNHLLSLAIGKKLLLLSVLNLMPLEALHKAVGDNAVVSSP